MTTPGTTTTIARAASTTTCLSGEEAANLRAAFPARQRATAWPVTQAHRNDVLDRLQQPPFEVEASNTQSVRMVGARLILKWLETFPGNSWQERWIASPASVSYTNWFEAPTTWGLANGRKPCQSDVQSGLLALIGADVIRPDLHWLADNNSRHLRPLITAARDPEGFARLQASVPSNELATRTGSKALHAIARIVAAFGGGVDDITVGDVLSLLDATKGKYFGAVRLAYRWLRDRGQFPAAAPSTIRSFTTRSGQVSPAELVDRYQLKCKPVRDLLVAYLTERQPSLDYSSLRNLSRHLAGLFWADLERHHPGINTLHLPPEVREAWKARIAVKRVRKRQCNGTMTEVIEPRATAPIVKMLVRAFYLDIAHWALDEPERWGIWAAPSPVSEAECATKKLEQEQKSRSAQRTRERLPVLPELIRTADRRLKEARARLEAVDQALLGTAVSVLGETFVLPNTTTRADGRPGFVYDVDGRRRHLRAEERLAFTAWATVEILRLTGIRIEELLEIGHHSIISYKLPTTQEIVPLLQIAPSKTDQERLLLVSPELADVLSAVITRVRQSDGAIPAVQTYDVHEKIWNAPMPVLFQWIESGERRSISVNSIRRALNETLAATGLIDKSGAPLKFQPHDFRRIFITDAILNGLPPHIAQVIAGHGSIGTTMGYAAIYPADAIEAHRAFIARRRSLRPAEEYRAVSPEEWDEFLGHFQKRKLALGECGRAYGTDCTHEHACVRCPVLIVGPDERPRLEEIRDNLQARISEAEREGWLGDVERLSVSLVAAEEKIAQFDTRRERMKSPVFLGVPTIGQVAARRS